MPDTYDLKPKKTVEDTPCEITGLTLVELSAATLAAAHFMSAMRDPGVRETMRKFSDEVAQKSGVPAEDRPLYFEELLDRVEKFSHLQEAVVGAYKALVALPREKRPETIHIVVETVEVKL